MPLMSVWSRNASLSSNYGSNHAAIWPNTIEVLLFTDDPRLGGVEISDTTVVGGVAVPNGYAPVTVANTNAVFPPPIGSILATEPIAFPVSLEAWDDTATWALLRNPTNGAWLDAVELNEEVDVNTAGFRPRVVLEIKTDEETD